MTTGVGLTIANPGWAGKAFAKVADPVFSLDVAGPGTFSGILTAAEAHGLGFAELLDRWIEYEDPDFGSWRGIVTDVTWHDAEGLLELTAQTFHMLLDGRLTRESQDAITAPAAALAIRAIQDADMGGEASMMLTGWQIDGSTSPLTWQWSGESLIDEIDQIAGQAGMEWRVTGDRVFQMWQRLGSDRRGSIEWIIGLNATASTTRRTTQGIVNDLLAIGGDDTYLNAHRERLVDWESVNRLRRRQGSTRYPELVTRSGIRSRAKADLARLSKTPGSIRIGVIRSDDWGVVREGDRVSIVSPAANRAYDARVMALTVDRGTGLMDVVATIEEEEA